MSKIKKIIAILLILVFAFAFGGCFDLSGSNSQNKSVTITLHDGAYSKEFSVIIDGTPSIDELTKTGYYSIGYYTSETGGEKYFDANGKSLTSWSIDYPTDFYVQYRPISELQLQSTHYSSDPKEITYYEGTIVKTTPEFLTAMKCNPNSTLNVSTSFSVYDTKNEDWVVYYKSTNKFEEGNLRANEIASKYNGYVFDATTSYASYSYTTQIPVSKMVTGDKMTFIYSRGAAIGKGAIKNLTINISMY